MTVASNASGGLMTSRMVNAAHRSCRYKRLRNPIHRSTTVMMVDSTAALSSHVILLCARLLKAEVGEGDG